MLTSSPSYCFSHLSAVKFVKLDKLWLVKLTFPNLHSLQLKNRLLLQPHQAPRYEDCDEDAWRKVDMSLQIPWMKAAIFGAPVILQLPVIWLCCYWRCFCSKKQKAGSFLGLIVMICMILLEWGTMHFATIALCYELFVLSSILYCISFYASTDYILPTGT